VRKGEQDVIEVTDARQSILFHIYTNYDISLLVACAVSGIYQ
jgi:hypothetical protein